MAMPLVPLPPGSAHHTWNDLIEIMARLRRSCPWDREQTHRTLVPYLIEETYEVVEAIELGDEAALAEFLTYGFRAALPKPFTRHELAHVLQRAFEAAREG